MLFRSLMAFVVFKARTSKTKTFSDVEIVRKLMLKMLKAKKMLFKMLSGDHQRTHRPLWQPSAEIPITKYFSMWAIASKYLASA